MRYFLSGAALLCAALGVIAAQSGGGTRTIGLAELRDKIEGGWAGQMIGVSFGAPTEFKFQRTDHRGSAARVETRARFQLDQSGRSVRRYDLREGARRERHWATTEDFGAMFREAQYALWHANLAAASRAEARSARYPVRHAEVQRPRQRHRFSDRGRFYRSDGARPPAGRDRPRMARRPRDELRRRHLRRHLRLLHVFRRLLREGPAQGGAGRPRVSARKIPMP